MTIGFWTVKVIGDFDKSCQWNGARESLIKIHEGHIPRPLVDT